MQDRVLNDPTVPPPASAVRSPQLSGKTGVSFFALWKTEALQWMTVHPTRFQAIRSDSVEIIGPWKRIDVLP